MSQTEMKTLDVSKARIRFENENDLINLGPEAADALRRDQLRILVELLQCIRDTEEVMPAVTDATVRTHLEDLGRYLEMARCATDALWCLAPEYDDGGYPE